MTDTTRMSIEQIYDLLAERGVSPTDFWAVMMGGDRAALPREDVESTITKMMGPREDTRTLIDWMGYQLPEHALVSVTRYPEHDVVLVADSMTVWAARINTFDAVAQREVTYALYTDEHGQDHTTRDRTCPVATQAYTDLCQDVAPLAADARGVAAACEEYGIDPQHLED